MWWWLIGSFMLVLGSANVKVDPWIGANWLALLVAYLLVFVGAYMQWCGILVMIGGR